VKIGARAVLRRQIGGVSKSDVETKSKKGCHTKIYQGAQRTAVKAGDQNKNREIFLDRKTIGNGHSRQGGKYTRQGRKRNAIFQKKRNRQGLSGATLPAVSSRQRLGGKIDQLPQKRKRKETGSFKGEEEAA